jgi:hypothetical protein
MAAQGGFGLKLKITISTTLTLVISLRDGKFPQQFRFLAESTGHDATSGYYTAVDSGKKRLQPFTVKVAWDADAATHAAILTAFSSSTPVTWSVEDPQGDEVMSFSAFVESIDRMSTQEGIVEADIVIHPTGAPTIT